MAKPETYPPAVARLGNARRFRIDAALFEAHPELHDSSFEATYTGPGTILVQRRRTVSRPNWPADDDADLFVTAYLAWTARTMTVEPHHLRWLTEREFAIAEALVEGIDGDLERDLLSDDCELPGC